MNFSWDSCNGNIWYFKGAGEEEHCMDAILRGMSVDSK